MITDIVGLEDGLGVECLSGSGAIASAYARAFRDGLTITLVSGRTVGIGAYLARLGRRCAAQIAWIPCTTNPSRAGPGVTLCSRTSTSDLSERWFGANTQPRP